MEICELHQWPGHPSDAAYIQKKFKDQVIIESSLDQIDLIAGVDTAFDHTKNLLYSGVAMVRYPAMEEVEKTAACGEAVFPNIPGLEAFREGAVILDALSKLETVPDLIIFSGHGIAHANRFGLACHLGLILNLPTIGVARKKLIGRHNEVKDEKGNQAKLIAGNNQIGVVYRSKTGVKPIYISPGHLCGVDDSIRVVSSCLSEYRLPDPLHFAHRWVNLIKRKRDQTTSDERIDG